ncbi:MAG: metal-dependent phosphohydrolase, partial [Deltaproteobacteria bacterium]|nr:metal-dependent phosphohydrolase [Deltaproteobacteria bacterium]
MNKAIENSIKDTVKPLLEKGRNGDWGHTLRVVEYGRYLLEHEEGDE